MSSIEKSQPKAMRLRLRGPFIKPFDTKVVEPGLYGMFVAEPNASLSVLITFIGFPVTLLTAYAINSYYNFATPFRPKKYQAPYPVEYELKYENGETEKVLGRF
ncbi:NADH-ubiquinone oxidoreductase chain 1 [Acrasis kona]|uniref:NADH-ubiquinone oxidoreductase chain 1 n=1 Tax=Acrasis kona TaxID=1008807 RepID=A0AAW2Z0N2_9EUKA